MAGILRGKHAGFLSEEIFSEDMNIEAVDGDLLAEELEQAQEQLFAEQEKFNIAIEAECETEETKQEIMEALESDINDVVYAKLLVNKLSKNNTLFYGDSKPLTSGLESDRNSDAKTILTAGLEDAKGMVNAIKEFIAKVWQKIKDAFAWIWKKMKDFWNWLIGANQKADETTNKSIVAVAALEAIVNKAGDIKKATEDIKANKYKPEKKSKPLIIKQGKFKGKDYFSLSADEVDEFMNENIQYPFREESAKNSTQEGEMENLGVVDAVVVNIIVEEVAKSINTTEEQVMKALPVGSMKNMIVFAYNPKNTDRILKIINDNISEKIKKAEWKEDIDSTLLNIAFIQTAVYGATPVNGMAINKLRPVNLFADFREWLDANKKTIDEKINGYVLGKESFTGPDNVGRSNALMTALLKNFVYRDAKSGITPIEDICNQYTLSLKYSVENIINISNNLRNILKNFDSGNENLETINVLGFGKADQLNLFLPLEYNAKTNTGTFFTAVGSYDVNFYNNKISDTLEFEKTDLERYAGMNFIGSDVSKTKGSFIYTLGKANMVKVEESINHMIKFMDDVLKDTSSSNIDTNGFSAMSDYKKIQSNLVTMANRASLLSIKSIRDLCYTYSVYGTKINNLLDIPGAIAQAAKELK